MFVPARSAEVFTAGRRRAAVYCMHYDDYDPAPLRRSYHYAAAIGACVVEIFSDRPYATPRLDERPAFRRMIESAKSLELKVVIIEDDRVGRMPYVSPLTYEVLMQNGIELHSPLFGRWSAIHITCSALLNGTAGESPRRRRRKPI